MTTTLVYGDALDGYVYSTNASYSTARSGPATGVNTGATALYGQKNNGASYTLYETFLKFAYPALPAGEVVTSATVRTTQTSQPSVGIARDMEIRGTVDWTAGGLTTADWRTPTQLTSATLYGRAQGVQSSAGKNTYTGTEALRGLLASAGVAAFVIVSSRQRAGTSPTTDEASVIATSEASGTTSDPVLIYTSTPAHHLLPGLGAEAQLSDGTWVYITHAPAAATATLWHQPETGAANSVASLPIGTGTTDWADVAGVQGLTLTVDDGDHIYVVGRAGDAVNSIRSRAYVKGTGYTWTAGSFRTLPLQAHDAPINSVAAAWHPTAGGTLVVFASHAAGDAISSGNEADVTFSLLDATYLRTGVGSGQNRGTGSALTAGLLPTATQSSDFNGPVNETGTGLDVVADRFQRDWGYLVSFKRAARLGDNDSMPVARYILNSTGTGFSHASYGDGFVYGKKDASARARVLNVGSGQVAVVSADAAAGAGISVRVFQASGTTPGFVGLGSVLLAGESIASMPDGPAVATSPAWDVVYAAAQNALWVYYVDAANAARVMKTSVDLDTYQATRLEVQALVASGAVAAIRAPRNSWADQKTHVTLAVPGGSTSLVDTFNLAPTAPTLIPRANFDATTAAVLDWTFNDPNVGDTQSARRVVVERVSDGVAVVDTAKTASTATDYTLAAGTLANGVEYRWRVMTWDSLDVASPWSDYGTFSTSAGGTVTITDPATDNPAGLITDDLPVSWSVTGTTQAKVRVWVTRGDTGTTVFDTGWITSAATSQTVTGMVSDVEHTISVQVESSGAVRSGIGTRKVTPSYGTPEVPLITVEAVPDGGYVLVTVDNPAPGDPALGAPLYDFETDVNALTPTSCTIVQSVEQAHSGTGSAKHTTTGTGVASRIKSAEASLFTVVPGRRYTARFWCYSATGYANHVAAINWKPTDPAGATISTSTGPSTNVPAGVWTLVSVTATAPAGAVHAIYGPSFAPSPASGYVFYVDELHIVEASDRPDVVRNVVLRRRAGSQDLWEVLGECEPDGAFRDYAASGGVPLEYMVRGESA